MVLPDYGHFCYTAIPENIYLINNNIPNSRYVVLSYPHIDGAKYIIYSSKTENSTKINIHRITKILRIKHFGGYW